MNGENKRIILHNLILRNPVVIALFGAVTALLLVLITSSSYVLRYDNVYKGVIVGNESVGNLSYNELTNHLNNRIKNAQESDALILKVEDKQISIPLEKLQVSYDVQKITKEAFDIGRKGDYFSRLGQIVQANLNGNKIQMKAIYNKDGIDSAIEELYSRTYIEVKEHDLTVQEGVATIASGHKGLYIDKKLAIEKTVSMLENGKVDAIELEFIETLPKKVDIEVYYQRLTKPSKDATLNITDTEYTILPSEDGFEVGKKELEDILMQMDQSQDKRFQISLKVIKPKKTKETIEATLFKDVLGKMDTRYESNTDITVRRTRNLEVATGFINGKIIMPGKTFSFNEVVGPRTTARGFKMAYVYTATGAEEGLGGGICQVASTLHLAAVYSGMNITERGNHSYTVTYVPLGLDAAIAAPSQDLKFSNPTSMPIKVMGYLKGNRLYFSIVGTNEHPGREISLVGKKLSEAPFSEQFIDDPTQNVGFTKLEHIGMKGYSYDTYMVIKENGIVTSNKKVYHSVYRPYPKTMIRGTKIIEVATSTQITAPVEPAR